MSEVRILDVGCGVNKVPGAIGIDACEVPGVDIVHDLFSFPWPFEDNEFDEVIANHFMEHCVDVSSVIAEIHRVTKKNTGRIRIRSPHYSSWNYYGDLTHRTPFSFRSFDHFSYDDPTGYNFYSPVKVKIEKRALLFAAPNSKLNPWKWFGVEFFANRFPKVYERLFAFIIPCVEVQFVLTPVEDKEDFEARTSATVEPAA